MLLDLVNLSTFIPVDKVVHEVSGSFTYVYTTDPGGGLHTIANPEPGNLFLPFSIFQKDGEDFWRTDMDDRYSFLTCVTLTQIKYRWAVFGSLNPDETMYYRTVLLSME